MTQKQLENLCKLWQERLRLQDWDIEIRFNPKIDATVLGLCYPMESQYFATIEIAPEKVVMEDYPEGGVERVVVHELLHILFDPNQLWARDPGKRSAQNRFYERSIDKMAKILMEAYA